MDKIFENAKKYLYIVLIILLISVAVIGTLLYIHVQSKQNLYEVENGKFINSKGKVIFELPKEYNLIGKYRDGNIVAGIKKEEVQIDTGSDSIIDMRAIANLVIIDNKGHITKLPYDVLLEIDDNFDLPLPIFQNGYIILQDKDGYHLINQKGKEIKNKNIKTILRNNINPVVIKDKTGMVTGYYLQDKNGKEIFRTNENTKYKYWVNSSKLSEGLLLVSDKDMYGNYDDINFAYVNKYGKIILEIPQYKIPIIYQAPSYWNTNSDFHNGLANVIDKNTGKEVYINKQGKEIIKGNYTYSTPFDNNIAMFTFCQEEDYGTITDCYKRVYVNRKGQTIYEFKEEENQNRFASFESGFDFDKLRKIKIKQETEPEYLYDYKAY